MNSFLHFCIDFLLLTKLDDVNLSNNDQLRAIGAICPNLQLVVFTMKNHVDYSDRTMIELDLTEILNKWPKVIKKFFCTSPYFIIIFIFSFLCVCLAYDYYIQHRLRLDLSQNRS